MKLQSIFLLIIFILHTGCAVQKDSESGEYKADIFIPGTKQTWRVKDKSTTIKDIKSCTIYSSHNGVDVILQKNGNNQVVQKVASSTSMDMATRLKVSVNNHVYYAVGRDFSSRDSAAIIEDFKTGDVVYIEWSTIYPMQMGSLRRRTNIIHLTNFNEIYNKCLEALS